MSASTPGVYGKLPTHGDFIQRNLSAAFVTPWDEWLQHFVAGAQEKMGGDWLDIYLTSPIWRFALSPGVVDEDRWAGILMPSVDQVGRYFPFTVVLKLPPEHNPMEFLGSQAAWYEQVEQLALNALDGELPLDELVDALAAIECRPASAYVATGERFDSFALHIGIDAEASLASAYPALLDALLVKLASSYSVWSTAGSERVAPCVFGVQGLPPVSKLPAMLDGEWRHWGWQQPYAPLA